jgi:head-tail adaptor
MTAGKLDQFITIQRKTRVSDMMGGYSESWATWQQVWAGAVAKAGRESIDEGRTNAVFVVVFTIYTLDGLAETDRILWNGETYNIRGVLRMGGRELHTKVEAERGVAS